MKYQLFSPNRHYCTSTVEERAQKPTTKESYSRVNEGKQQSKQFIIYDLDSIVRVNDRKTNPILKKKF